MADFVFAEELIGAINVGGDDRDVLEPAIVAARIARNHSATRGEVFGKLQHLIPELQCDDAGAQAEDVVEMLVLLASDFGVALLLKWQDMGVEIDGAIHVIDSHADAQDGLDLPGKGRGTDTSRRTIALDSHRIANSFTLLGAKTIQQVIPDAQGIGHNRQSGIHCAAGREEAGVNDVEVVDVMRAAVFIQNRCCGIVAKTKRSILMRNAGERNALADKEIARDQMLMTADVIQRAFKLGDQALVAFFVIGLV